MPETEHKHGITCIRNLQYGVALGNRDNHASKRQLQSGLHGIDIGHRRGQQQRHPMVPAYPIATCPRVANSQAHAGNPA